MRQIEFARRILREAVTTYWSLVRTIVPVMIVTRIAVDLGLVKAVAPSLAPVMALLGLPAELGFAWLTGVLVGFWPGAVALFAVMPVGELTSAQVTVFLGLLLIAHGLPVEQRIIQVAGPGFVATTVLRLLGGFLYAYLLHLVFSATGWLNTPAAPHWVPANASPDLSAYVAGAAEGLAWMFVILLGLLVAIRLLEALNLFTRLADLLAPALRVCGIGKDAAPVTMIGLLLGITYGGGLIRREAELGRVGPRDLFLACVLMGFAHSIIEDTAVSLALGGDVLSLLVGRVLFAIVAVALLARLIKAMPDRDFGRYLFRAPTPAPDAR